ncbi:hypothetical protein AB0H42_33565 [Nocardia sp. NPDC050799]|uniref:hypothetical protein n=1 Tax=Nocardia sp. NPDC050799 TaxID=3154842 RepID=UPI0033EE77B2
MYVAVLRISSLSGGIVDCRIVEAAAHRLGRGDGRDSIVACIGGCGVRGGQVIAYRFAEDIAGDGGGDSGGGISQSCRESIPCLGELGIECAHTFGAVDIGNLYAELFGEPVP